MILDIGLFALGLLLLYFGAEGLVKGAGRLARSFGISSVVVGLTVVAYGTSTPELIVSFVAAMQGQSDLSLGNVVGSNIFNIGFVLALSALIRPTHVDLRFLTREIPIMLGVAVLLYILSFDGLLARLDGIILLIGIAAYTFYAYKSAKREPDEVAQEFETFERERKIVLFQSPGARSILLVLGGIMALVIGAKAMVTAAVSIARAFGVPELIIGLSIVAAGTGLPELATSVLAAVRKEGDISVGNLVGSNIYNVLAIVGISATIQPMSVNTQLLRVDIPVMLAFSLALVPIIFMGKNVTRLEAILLLACYCIYLYFIL